MYKLRESKTPTSLTRYEVKETRCCCHLLYSFIEGLKDCPHDAVTRIRFLFGFGFEIKFEQCSNTLHGQFVMLKETMHLQTNILA